jgi:CheY-like chemotaxis protein
MTSLRLSESCTEVYGLINSPCILLVDDQPDLLNNLSLALEVAGYKPVTACNGIEAISILQTQPVDLILSDIEMPHMNGYQLYQQVRQNPAWNDIPFLFLSIHTLDTSIKLGADLTPSDYLTKPIRLTNLLNVVRNKLTH